ncbi:hypothetical protein [Pseudoduganella sp. HUAS MS19]
MHLVDITPLPAAHEIMEPATKQSIDSCDARAEAREAAARERELMRQKNFNRLDGAIASLKGTVVTTGIIATLSTVFGVAAFNAALMRNVFAAIELGQKSSPAQVKMRADVDEIKRQLAEARAATER